MYTIGIVLVPFQFHWHVLLVDEDLRADETQILLAVLPGDLPNADGISPVLQNTACPG